MVDIKYDSDYFTEMKLISIIYNRVVYYKEDISDLAVDVNQFLFDRFLLNLKQEVFTDYARLLYYLVSESIHSTFNELTKNHHLIRGCYII